MDRDRLIELEGAFSGIALRHLGHEDQVGDHLAAAAEVAGGDDAVEIGMGAPQSGGSRCEECGGAVDQHLSLRAPHHVETLQDAVLEGGAKSLAVLQQALTASIL
jgi:hypothetical protein